MTTEQTPGERNNAAVAEAKKRPHRRTAFYIVSEGDEAMIFALDEGFQTGTVEKIKPAREHYGIPIYKVWFTDGRTFHCIHHAVSYIFEPASATDRLTAAEAALEAANERYAEALLEGLRHTLVILALKAREVFPEGEALILGHSDQGDFADFEAVEVGGVHETDEGLTDEITPTAWNLRTESWTEWQTFADPDYEARYGWRLPIDAILTYDGDFDRHIADRLAAQQ